MIGDRSLLPNDNWNSAVFHKANRNAGTFGWREDVPISYSLKAH
jgi:hypothetical protein